MVISISGRTLTGVKFVKFEMYRTSQSVDARLKNDVPPTTNPDYRYAPVPVDLIPPVGENRLMHFFYNSDCAENVLVCLGGVGRWQYLPNREKYLPRV